MGEEPVDELITCFTAGSQFAQFILDKAKFEAAENAAGLNVPRKKEVKQYPAFRNTFLGTQGIPLLWPIRIFVTSLMHSLGRWKSTGEAGKKLLAMSLREASRSRNGPKKPVEWLKYAEKETRVYGAKRRIMPFSTSKSTLHFLIDAPCHISRPLMKLFPILGRALTKFLIHGDSVVEMATWLAHRPSCRSRGVANKFNHWDRLYRT